MAGTITTVVLTPGTWVQGPAQAVTSVLISPIRGLQVGYSATPGDAYVVMADKTQAMNVANKTDLSQLWFRVFGAPVKATITWS